MIVGVLELDGEVGKHLIFVFPYFYLFSMFPELFGHPVGDVGNGSKIDQISSHILDFLSE